MPYYLLVIRYNFRKPHRERRRTSLKNTLLQGIMETRG